LQSSIGLVCPKYNNTDNQWFLTNTGELLTAQSEFRMDAAARLWGDDHYRRWLALANVLRGEETQTSPSYFEQLEGQTFETYYRAISAYAQHDYAKLPKLIDWNRHQHLIDAGGSRGILLFSLLAQHPHLSGTLIDLPAVVQSATIPEQLTARCHIQGADLFETWPIRGDAIILARVLHDWPDEQAKQLLFNAREALLPGGKIYIIEMVLPDDTPNGGLLDINLLVITGGRERSLKDWNALLAECSLKMSATQHLSEVSTVIVATKV